MPNFAAVKKALILILAVIYIGLTSGVMVNVHYCMGKVASVNYGHAEDEDCGTCGMEKQDGCCHTDHKFIKADEDHVFAKQVSGVEVPIAELPLSYFENTPFHYRSDDINYSRYHSPPDPRHGSICLYNRVFRI